MLQQHIDRIIREHMITAYIKTSALTGKNIELLFEQLAGVLDCVFPLDSFQVVPPDHS